MSEVETLDTKVARSAELMKDILRKHAPEKIAVAWTGGKDSTVALAVWREVLRLEGLADSPRALSIDTGVKFPEVMAFRDSLAEDWNVALEVVWPEVDISSYPVADDAVACCRELKVEPLMNAVRREGMEVLISGIRRDEHPSRLNRKYLEQRDDPSHLMLNPLLDWTEMDIWSFITMHGLPFCELYNEGYRSLGCKPCTRIGSGDERQGRNPSKEENLELLTSLGYF